jgi:hypothetical protein
MGQQSLLIGPGGSNNPSLLAQSPSNLGNFNNQFASIMQINPDLFDGRVFPIKPIRI